MLQNLLLSVLLVFTSTSIYRQPNAHQNTPQRGVYGTYTPNQTNQNTYRGFGYGSQATYQVPVTFQVDGTYYSQPNQYYGTTYDYGNGGIGRPGSAGPKRVRGYDSDGNGVGDDNGSDSDFWEDGYEYYWDGSSWWRKDPSGYWQKYTNFYGFMGWHWSYTSLGGSTTTKPKGVEPGYRENPTPIGSPLTMAIPAALYAIIEYRRRRESNEEFA